MRTRQALERISPYSPGILKPGAIKLASNENPLGPSPKAMEYIREHAHLVNLYPDPLADALRARLSAIHGVEADQILVGNGSDEILVFIAAAYMTEKAKALTSESTFSEYTFASILFDGTMKYVPLNQGRYDLEAMAEAIDETTRVVFLCNPNNPTGTCFSKREFDRFLDKVGHDVLVVSDEAYFEFVDSPDFPDTLSLIADHPNLLVMRTFSKIYGLAGMRIGYSIGNRNVIADLRKTKEPFNVNLLAQGAALAALDDSAFLQKSRALSTEGKRYYYDEIGKLGLEYYESQANFVAVRIGMDAKEAFKKLMDLGVTIRPLSSFGLADWIRITIGTEEQNRFTMDCLRKIL